MKKLQFLLLITLFSTGTTAQVPLFITDSLDSYIATGLKDWNIPGLSIVIVKNGQVVHMKGYGIRDLVSKKPVDEQTLFMIASNTKLFTGTALALLETQGKLSLNDKINKYFPTFRLYDPNISKLVTIRDLLSHRIGTKTFQGDFTFWNTTLSREEIMKRMRLLKPSFIFRQDYGYCNSCFMSAGQVIPKVSGQSWENFIRDTFLIPLDMKTTMTLSTGMSMQPNIAFPYTTSYTNTLVQVPFDNWNNLAPAASMISNVNDLSHWLLMQLDSGRYQGKQVIPWSSIQKTRDVNIVTGSRRSSLLPVHFRGYGLGLFTSDYNGSQVYWHTGGAGGMVSNVCFVPEKKLGIAILTNNDNQGFFEALRYQLLDVFLDVPYVNRSYQQLDAFKKDMNTQVDEINKWKAKVRGTQPELSLSAYSGSYTNELYGKILISQQGKQLKIDFSAKPDLTATLDYMENGEWLMQYNQIEYGIFSIRFTIIKGKVFAVTTKQNEFVEIDPYTFLKD